jgi:hypothetical protein
VVGRTYRRRIAAIAVGFLIAASTASAHGSSVSLRRLTTPVFIGQTITVRADVQPGGAHCLLAISYSGGRVQKLPERVAGASGVSWAWRIPAVRAGRATARLSCAEAGRATMTFQVQAPLQAPKIVVERTGFTQRMNEKTGKSDVSFGLELRNARARVDAVGLAILVNLVDAENRVVATDHLRLVRIPASATVYTGDQVRFGLLPVARVEVVAVQALSHAPAPATPPLISDVFAPPDRFGYIDTVYGQALNQFRLPMQGGELGIVLEDAEGNVIGGGRGSVHGPVSLGARELFKTSGSLDAVSVAQTAAVRVSIVPRYPRQ